MMSGMFFLFVAVFFTHNIDKKITFAQVSIVPHGSFALLEPLVLECQITSFSSGATWSHDYGINLLTQCFSGGLCTDSGSGNYNYFSNNSGIFVTIVSLTADEKGITWTCSHSPFSDNFTIPEPGPPLEKKHKARDTGMSIQASLATVASLIAAGFTVGPCIQKIFTAIRVKKWFPVFSRQYVFCGRVVFGIHIVIVAASIQLSTIITAAIILSVYSGQYDDSTILLLVLLIPLYSVIGVFIFLLIVACCGQVDKSVMVTESGSQDNSVMVSKTGSLDKKLVINKSGSLDKKLMITKSGSLDKSVMVTESGLQKGQTALLFIVIFIPLAWFVLLISLLILRKNCSESGNVEQGDVNKEEEKVEQDVQKEKEKGKPEEEKGKSDVNKEKEKGKLDVKEEAGKQEQDPSDIGQQNVWAHTHKGRKLPNLPDIEKRNDEGKDPAQNGNKKRKRKKQKNAVSNDDTQQYKEIHPDQIVTSDEADRLNQMTEN